MCAHQGRWSILLLRGFQLVANSHYGRPACALPHRRLQGPDRCSPPPSRQFARRRRSQPPHRGHGPLPVQRPAGLRRIHRNRASPARSPATTRCPLPSRAATRPLTVDFLISTDGKTLARLETFDLAKDPVFSIDVAGRPIRGNPAAKVTVINFDDLECPYCARLHQSLFPDTLARYKDKVRFIYKDNPLPADMHPWAMHAAVDANCLAAQSGDVYWTYVDYLHGHGDEVTGPDRNLPKSFASARSHRPPGSYAGQARRRQAGRLPHQAGRDSGARIAREAEA
jgi:hypothetical protein